MRRVQVIVAAVLGALLCVPCARPVRAALPPALPSCSALITNLSFGTYDVFARQDAPMLGNWTFQCRNLPAGTLVQFNLSAGGSGDFNNRYMTRDDMASEKLRYQVCSDVPCSQIFGDGTGDTANITLFGAPANFSMPVFAFGRVYAGQDVREGHYSDTMEVTIEY